MTLMDPALKRRMKALGIRSLTQLHQVSPGQLVELQQGLSKCQLEILNNTLLGIPPKVQGTQSNVNNVKAHARRRKRGWVARTRSNGAPYSPFKEVTQPVSFSSEPNTILQMNKPEKKQEKTKSMFLIERTTHFSRRDPYEERLFKSLHGNFGENMNMYHAESDARPGWDTDVQLHPDMSRTRCFSYMTPELQQTEQELRPNGIANRPKSAPHSRVQQRSSTGGETAEGNTTSLAQKKKKKRRGRRKKKKKKIACAVE
jgi:hypothetical protein